jgi:hypothetical protein
MSRTKTIAPPADNNVATAEPVEDRRVAVPESRPAVNLAAWSVPRNIAEAIALAEVVHKSNMYPNLRNPGQVLLCIMAGAELGMGVHASLSDIPVVEGKLDPGAAAWGSTIRRSDRYDYVVVERSDTACELAAWERDGNGSAIRKGTPGWTRIGSLRYTIEEAQRKGWDVTQGGKVKSVWLKTPANMLFARCLKDLKRTYFPDVGANTYSADELDVDDSTSVATVTLPALHTPCEQSAPVTDAEIVPTAPVSGTEAPSAPASHNPLYSRIEELVAAGNFPPDRITAYLDGLSKRTGRVIARYADMTDDEAAAFIGQLEKTVAQQKATSPSNGGS